MYIKNLYPVLHFNNLENARSNIDLVLEVGCKGIFLINMGQASNLEFQNGIDCIVKEYFNLIKIGVNRLSKDPASAIKENITDGISITWEDYTGVHSDPNICDTLIISEINQELNPNHKFFGSVAFKYQILDNHPEQAAKLAADMGWIVTTSGPGTGQEADINKIKKMKTAIGDDPLAIASGISPENVDMYLPYVDYYLVSTGISKNFHQFDQTLLTELAKKINNYEI